MNWETTTTNAEKTKLSVEQILGRRETPDLLEEPGKQMFDQ
jgi:hypothetical protein